MCSKNDSNYQNQSLSATKLDQANKTILELQTRLKTNQHNFNELMNDMFLLGQLSVHTPILYGEILRTVTDCYYQKETIIQVDEINSITLGRVAAIDKSMRPKSN